MRFACVCNESLFAVALVSCRDRSLVALLLVALGLTMFFVFFVFVVIGIVFVASLVLYSTWYNMPGGHAEVAPIGNLLSSTAWR